jgi:hypothetical protein
VNEVIQVLRRPSSIRIVAAGTLRVPSLPRTSTVAARPEGVRAVTARPSSSPSRTDRSLRFASRSVNVAVHVW